MKAIGGKDEKEIKDERAQLDLADSDEEWADRVKKYKEKDLKEDKEIS